MKQVKNQFKQLCRAQGRPLNQNASNAKSLKTKTESNKRRRTPTMIKTKILKQQEKTFFNSVKLIIDLQLCVCLKYICMFKSLQEI